MKKLIFLLLPLLAPLRASALELLLEENRGESGTIGYVDIDKVFKQYSGTTGARDEFLAEIRKKEDAVNAKKTAIFTLKAEIAKLKQEREFALTLPSLLDTQRSIEAAVSAARPEAAVSTGAAQVFNQPAQQPPAQAGAQPPAAQTGAQPPQQPQPAFSTSAPQGLPPGAIPVLSSSTVQPRQPPPPQPGAQAAPQVQVSTAAQTTPPPQLPPGGLPGMEGIDMPGVTKVPVSHFKFSVSTSVPEIDAALSKKDDELKQKEEDLRAFQKQAERELLEYESHRSELLLGRIYLALKELAVKEEVSVIVDKRNILYGQNAVDLTDKLIKKLEAGGI
jgi:Skp family chaperone for outer membrane proteins